jgi:uncharacterized membrane protein
MPPRRARSSWMLVLSYLPLLGFIPLLARKGDREIRWHSKNGQLLFAAVVVMGITATLVGILIPSLSCLYGIFMFFIVGIYAIIVLLAIVKALQGERVIVPGVSQYVDRI